MSLTYSAATERTKSALNGSAYHTPYDQAAQGLGAGRVD